MADSRARLVEPDPTADTGAVEHAVPFRFAVTWTSVVGTYEAPKSSAAALIPVNVNARTSSSDEQSLKSPKKLPANSGVQWEMVVPKMVRSAPSPPPSRTRPALQRRQEPDAPAAAAEQTAPNFTVSPSLLARIRQAPLGARVLIVTTVLTGVIVPVWRHFKTPAPAPTEIQTTMRSGGWARERVTSIDAGFNRSRELVVYRPSLKAIDCRFEFNWKVNTPGIGWVFRAKDTANYYAMKIKVLKPGPSPTVSLEHFTVYRGTESVHSEKVLVLSRNDPVLHIRTDIQGPSFTVYLGATAAEYWNDTKLTGGGLGFFEEWRQGSEVEWVRMSFAPGTQIQRDQLPLYMNAPASGGD